ncbi:hypothetical protein HHK36_001810 [Tetracentron sinense]|uniref:Glutaredoxin domain-containing protein n=1 Tax=Tetracentron sinense TaxID=13715 RepID=A0A834ZWR3_TETSI|nr:hypothetical protein HHK36_001810 [Tetracentron sinense]
MQEALPYRTWLPVAGESLIGRPASVLDDSKMGGFLKGGRSVKNMVLENAVIVFGRRGCCMCHVVKRLLLGLGVNPAVYELDEEEEVAVIDELSTIGDAQGKFGQLQFPSVFIGGRLFGGLDRLMATHISVTRAKEGRVTSSCQPSMRHALLGVSELTSPLTKDEHKPCLEGCGPNTWKGLPKNEMDEFCHTTGKLLLGFSVKAEESRDLVSPKSSTASAAVAASNLRNSSLILQQNLHCYS